MIAAVLQAMRRRAKVKAVVHLMGIRVLALASNICCGLLTAAFLGPEGRGEQSAMGVAPIFLASICTLGLHASLVYNLRRDPEHGPAYFGAAIILAVAAGVSAGMIGFLVMPVWLGQYGTDTVSFARILLVSVPIGVVTPFFMVVLEVHGHFGLANRVLYLQSLATLALLGLCAETGWLTPMTAASAYVLPSLPTFLFLLYQARRVLRPRLTVVAPYPRRLLHYGLQFYGVDILGALAGYLDQMVIVYLLQPAAVGAYAVALSLSRVLSVAQGAVATVLFPSVAARDPASVVEMVARAMRVTTVVNAVGATALGLAGPTFLLLLYGPRFSAAVTPFLILLIEATVSSAARTLAQAFSGTGRPGMVTGVEAAGLCASLLGMVVLVPTHGIVGAAGAALFGGCVRLLFVLGSFRTVIGIGLPRLVVGRADITWMTGR